MFPKYRWVSVLSGREKLRLIKRTTQMESYLYIWNMVETEKSTLSTNYYLVIV